MKAIKILFYILAPIAVFGLSTYLTISLVLKFQKTTICPDVRGKTVERAREIVKEQGLSLVVMRYERRNDVPYNHITVQKPEANISTKKGRVVYVVVSEGPELMKIPMLAGLDPEQARQVLEERRLVVERTVIVPHAKAGRVIAQSPAAGSEILEFGKVVLFVGTPVRTYFLMADTKNASYNELADEMDSKGIRYRINYARGTHVSPRDYVDYSIPAGMIFSSNEEITVTIF